MTNDNGKTFAEQSRRIIDILGIRVVDTTQSNAIRMMEQWIRDPVRKTRRLYFVNTHTLNLAADDPTTKAILNSADAIFGDGTGVRWAARLQGITVMDNLAGTDLIPEFMRAMSGRGFRYYLLGANPETIEKAAHFAIHQFPGWDLVGFHSGYLTSDTKIRVMEDIRTTRPDMLLVGMGQPKQERFLFDHRDSLSVPLCVGVGGLFDHWGGNLQRAAPWIRQLGFEWAQLLLQQPHKARRYLIGNPKFLGRIALEFIREARSHG